MSDIFEILFGCWHKNYTSPRAIPGTKGQHYIVCLDCGKEWAYDWNRMMRLEEIRVNPVEPWPGYGEWLESAERDLKAAEEFHASTLRQKIRIVS